MNEPIQHEFEPIFVTVQTACRLTGLGPSKIYELINAKAVESVKVGKRRLIKYASLSNIGATEAQQVDGAP